MSNHDSVMRDYDEYMCAQNIKCVHCRALIDRYDVDGAFCWSYIDYNDIRFFASSVFCRKCIHYQLRYFRAEVCDVGSLYRMVGNSFTCKHICMRIIVNCDPDKVDYFAHHIIWCIAILSIIRAEKHKNAQYIEVLTRVIIARERNVPIGHLSPQCMSDFMSLYDGIDCVKICTIVMEFMHHKYYTSFDDKLLGPTLHTRAVFDELCKIFTKCIRDPLWHLDIGKKTIISRK